MRQISAPLLPRADGRGGVARAEPRWLETLLTIGVRRSLRHGPAEIVIPSFYELPSFSKRTTLNFMLHDYLQHRSYIRHYKSWAGGFFLFRVVGEFSRWEISHIANDFDVGASLTGWLSIDVG